ncbi:MAG TPA: CsbD family protein [Candidatus Acidoferrum sp.]|nr:CsbD family protein [Candidatus Acidoferrum sp.]
MRINDDEVQGNVDKASGTVKQNIGRALGDPILENEGADQRTGGDIQAGFGKARRKVGEVVEDIGNKLGR